MKPYLIEGLDNIAAAVNRSDQTVRRWARRHGFPAAKLPGGTWASSTGLIDQWIIARADLMAERRGRRANAQG